MAILHLPKETQHILAIPLESRGAGPDARRLKQRIGRAVSLLTETGAQSRWIPSDESNWHRASFFKSSTILERIVGSGFAITCSRLVALLQEEDEDEPKPTFHAFINAWKLITEAEQFLSVDFPKAVVSADEEGGIRFRWRASISEREVRLYYPPTRNRQPYIYYEAGNDYGSEDATSVQVLAKWLTWLVRSENK